MTWFNEEIMRHDTRWEAPEHDLHRRQRAARIGRNLPPNSIEIGHRGEDEARTIIGEAMIEQVALVSTHNLDTSPDELMKELTEHHALDPYETTLRYTLRALPAKRAHWRPEYEQGLLRLHDCGLSWTAGSAHCALERESDFEQRIERAMRASATLRAQEERRMHARRRAAENEGVQIA